MVQLRHGEFTHRMRVVVVDKSTPFQYLLFSGLFGSEFLIETAAILNVKSHVLQVGGQDLPLIQEEGGLSNVNSIWNAQQVIFSFPQTENTCEIFLVEDIVVDLLSQQIVFAEIKAQHQILPDPTICYVTKNRRVGKTAPSSWQDIGSVAINQGSYNTHYIDKSFKTGTQLGERPFH